MKMQEIQSSKNRRKSVRFPIIEHICIDGYLLYPGKEDTAKNDCLGLDHPFLPGMNVIVGINGVGKTTLLNILFRMLAGDKDLRDGKELGDSKRSLASIADTAIFARIVPDRARDATATLKFRLGEHSIEIKRSLKNLELLEMKIDPPSPLVAKLDDLSDEYKIAVSRLAGVDDFYDFVLILRYLVFFLEDRRALIWDKSAQTEIFRILFYPSDANDNYKALLNEALSADSYARNAQSVLTKEKNRYEKSLKDAIKIKPDELNLLEIAVSQLRQSLDALKEKTSSLDIKRRSIRRSLEQNRSDTEKNSQGERALREHMLASIFPKLEDFSVFAISNIQSERGCIICGNQNEELLKAAHKRLKETLECPLCSADMAHQESHQEVNITIDHKLQLEKFANERVKLVHAGQTLDAELKQVQAEYLEAETKRWHVEAEFNSNNEKLKIAKQSSANGNPSQLDGIGARVKSLEETVNQYRSDKNEALVKIKFFVDALSANVETFQEEFCSKFSEFIGAFLAEECVLTHRNEPRNIGQLSSPVELFFPEFHVNMTSGVFRQSGAPRESIDSVSESQMEFIELAFRMSILATAASDDAVSLIMETPEASLDAVFIPRAGDLLNRFARSATKNPSTLITSSNLNGSEMIAALLGLLSTSKSRDKNVDSALMPPPEMMPVKERFNRVLNLLEFAAENAALHKFKPEYRSRLIEAIGTVS